jgi:hypothetical protein
MTRRTEAAIPGDANPPDRRRAVAVEDTHPDMPLPTARPQEAPQTYPFGV